MALTYIPRRQNPFQSQLPGFLQNLMFNQMAAKRQDEQLEAQTIAAQGKEARGYQAKGWRETGAHANAIKIGDKYYAPPEKGIQYVSKTVGGKSVLVPTETMTPIGGKPQYVKSGTPISSETKDPTTAMAAFLKQNPKATPQEIAAFKQTLMKQGSGFSLEMGPDGNLRRVSFGGNSQDTLPLTKTNTTKVQQEIMSNDDRISRVKGIMDTYQSNYTDKWDRLGKSWDQFKESWSIGTPLSAQDQKELGEFSVWKQNAVKDTAKEIHDFAGGNMTKHERNEVIAGLPDPGKKWYQGDSHTVYTNKLANTYKKLNLLNARKKYLLKQGHVQKDIDGMLDNNQIITMTNFKNKVDDAAVAKRKELTQQAKASGADLSDITVHTRITKAVLMFLNQDFGFAFSLE